MMFDEGFYRGIRYKFVSNWCRMDSYIYTKEKLLSEIERNMPDVVVMDIGLYEKMDWIETSRQIRDQFGVQLMYV